MVQLGMLWTDLRSYSIHLRRILYTTCSRILAPLRHTRRLRAAHAEKPLRRRCVRLRKPAASMRPQFPSRVRRRPGKRYVLRVNDSNRVRTFYAPLRQLFATIPRAPSHTCMCCDPRAPATQELQELSIGIPYCSACSPSRLVLSDHMQNSELY